MRRHGCVSSWTRSPRPSTPPQRPLPKNQSRRELLPIKRAKALKAKTALRCEALHLHASCFSALAS